MNIFDLLDKDRDINEEFEAIQKLFASKLIYAITNYGFRQENNSFTLENIADRHFCSWKNNCRAVNCSHFRDKLNKIISKFTTDVEKMIILLEYYVNIIHFVVSLPIIQNKVCEFGNNFLILSKNIDEFLEYVNYEKFFEDDRILLIPKNPGVTKVAEITVNKYDNVVVANDILKYNHYLLNGNIEEKRKILYSISHTYENFLHNHKTNGYSKEFAMVSFLLNNYNIRHDNKTENRKRKFIADLTDKELETIYDKTYQLILFCILSEENDKIMKEFEEMKKKAEN